MLRTVENLNEMRFPGGDVAVASKRTAGVEKSGNESDGFCDFFELFVFITSQVRIVSADWRLVSKIGRSKIGVKGGMR